VVHRRSSKNNRIAGKTRGRVYYRREVLAVRTTRNFPVGFEDMEGWYAVTQSLSPVTTDLSEKPISQSHFMAARAPDSEMAHLDCCDDRTSLGIHAFACAQTLFVSVSRNAVLNRRVRLT